MQATPKGLSDEKAGRMMEALRAGQTLRKFGVKALRLEAYFETHPEYAVEAGPLIEKNAKAAQFRKGSNRNKTHCKFGHPFAVYQRLNFDKGSVIRKCNMCHFLRYKEGGAVKPAVLIKVKAALERGATISSLTAAGRPTRLLAHHAFKRARRENPEIDMLAAKVIEGSRSRALHTRWTRVRNETRREQNNDYYVIRAMLPASFPDKDDVVNSIFEDLLTGALHRDDVRARVNSYVAAHNKLFPPKYAKFGDSALLSLDEAVFEDGGGRRGDNVTHSLWA
ncbi:hypothetical protein WI604_15925 [Bradyrhizobium symbiodeficiens]|uniref:hypothetical protein n=1 Tax=Bradyrhizobium symbiodeficiens TaxID=1404367 RepID=UPI0030D31E20